MGRSRPNFSPKLEPIHRTSIDDDYRLSVSIEKVTLCSELSVCTFEDLLVLIEWISHAILLTCFYMYLDASL